MITLLGENYQGQTPSQAELVEWADMFGLTHPVVADPGLSTTFRYVEGGNVGLPSMTLLTDGAEIVMTDTYVDEADVHHYLP